jgi:hypothetical protein
MEGSISWIISWIWTGLGVLVFDEMLHEKYQACWMSLFVVLTVDDFFFFFYFSKSMILIISKEVGNYLRL